LDKLFAKRDMTVVDRIETASQQCDAAFHSASQSRCGRNSEYSAASGLPGSGCQS
jgi:hypothetical protein